MDRQPERERQRGRENVWNLLEYFSYVGWGMKKERKKKPVSQRLLLVRSVLMGAHLESVCRFFSHLIFFLDLTGLGRQSVALQQLPVTCQAINITKKTLCLARNGMPTKFAFSICICTCICLAQFLWPERVDRGAAATVLYAYASFPLYIYIYMSVPRTYSIHLFWSSAVPGSAEYSVALLLGCPPPFASGRSASRAPDPIDSPPAIVWVTHECVCLCVYIYMCVCECAKERMKIEIEMRQKSNRIESNCCICHSVLPAPSHASPLQCHSLSHPLSRF